MAISFMSQYNNVLIYNKSGFPAIGEITQSL